MGQYVVGPVLGMGPQGDMGAYHNACIFCAFAPPLHTPLALATSHKHLLRAGIHMRADDIFRRQFLPRRHAFVCLNGVTVTIDCGLITLFAKRCNGKYDLLHIFAVAITLCLDGAPKIEIK